MEVYGFKDDKNREPVLAVSDIVDKIYPVGSIYMSVNNTNPSVLFGGTWAAISGFFLRGSSSAFVPKATGGQSNANYTPEGVVQKHTLTTPEMPSHSHKAGQDSSYSTVNAAEVQLLDVAMGTGETVNNYETTFNLKAVTTSSTGGGQGHDHGFSGKPAQIPTIPPYYVVNIWRRTA